MTALLVVDRTLPIELASTFDAYRDWLRADGYEADIVWADKTNNRNPKAHIALAENVVWPWVKAHTDGVVQFIGDLPIPYSGIAINPDGHGDTAGAYACAGYYVSPFTNWTDASANTQTRPARCNIAGDGRFDQSQMARPLASIGWLNLSRFNARTFGSTLTGMDWIIHCYRRYFERNRAYRSGEWKPQRRLGEGFAQGTGASWLLDLDANAVSWGRDTVKAVANGPYAVTRDFKSLDSQITKLTEPFTVLDLTYGSYQIDYLTQRTTNPLYSAALAVGSYGLGWNLSSLANGPARLGDLWLDTVEAVRQYNTVPILYGDATLTV